MLTAAVLVPALAAVALVLGRTWSEAVTRVVAVVASAVPLVLLVGTWIRFDTGGSQPFQLVEETDWIPTLGVGWRLGVDGISLALALLSALIFVVAVAYPVDLRGRHRQYRAWFLFLEAVSLGVFLSIDLLLFYVFFDLSLVGMYFLIGRWGHGEARAAALKFFLYTLAGSLVMLLGFLALYLQTDPLTFDMRVLIAEQPLAGRGATAGLALLAILVGLAVKTPLVPVHTWLPPAHVNAPGPASALLAGVLLKMGTFGMIRIPLSMMRDTFETYAPVLVGFALLSIIYGALVALGQTDLKRRIAYSSVNHMGYAVLGIAVAGSLGSGEEAGRRLALTGATVEMVAHGLITGALFLVAGSFWTRTQDYDMDHYGGLAGTAPRLTGAATLAAFASLGLPGLAGFVAELQIFVGTFSVYPWVAAAALVGVLITAALFLQMVQKLFFGDLPTRLRDFADLGHREALALVPLLVLVVVIGVWPTWLLDLLTPTSEAIVSAFGVR
ncbi:NADH-quinone oxidoreductase subunit M [Iamia majanohamensis]|uniref:NADH-quinone oxidoreductase subunit M n=1 Tax=Iamia majanohamensis TaxID=467976 RepID=A0AAF0BSB2_9ACTN|nr:NADH-quinone oxidoreductase subunit M [Iamia majanohamensis]WCO68031.1 NADH-quinone oxidoreductase subunit M [Iamia majanohamensis]